MTDVLQAHEVLSRIERRGERANNPARSKNVKVWKTQYTISKQVYDRYLAYGKKVAQICSEYTRKWHNISPL